MFNSGINRIVRSVVRARSMQRLRPLLSDTPSLTGRPCIVGLFKATSGMGTGARLLYAAFERNGFNPSIIDLTDLLASNQPQLEFNVMPPPAGDDGRGPVIFHLNPPELPAALEAIGVERLHGRYRVGFWAWELARLPEFWPRVAGFLDDVWTSSNFTAEAVRASIDNVSAACIPYLMPPPQVSADVRSKWRARLLPARLMPEGGKIVFCAFDARSSMERKNPLGAIQAFRDGAERHPDARLVIKANNLDWSPDDRDRLHATIAGDDRIICLTETLSDADMNGLIAAADIYLSPHRSEGFGLVMVKSLLAGTPVIMTGWSGGADFVDLPGTHVLDYRLSAARDGSGIYDGSQRWADPDLQQAARYLDELLAVAPEDSNRDMIANAAAVRFSQTKLIGILPDTFDQYVSTNLVGDIVNP